MKPEFYFDCYDLLVSTGNTNADIWDKQAFISYFTRENGREWRFCGHLGFGGKFRRDGINHYVSCYSEDETPERRAMIDDLNRRITRLMRRHNTP
jgi:hypothetical protein